MPRKSIVELEAQANVNLPNNSTGLIDPADVRGMFLDFLNAIRPAYGVLQSSAGIIQSLTTTPTKMLWATAQDSDINQTNSSAAVGRISRTERGTSTINFTADIVCTANLFVSFTLYKNGVATPWRITGVGAGTGNPVGVAMTAVDYADPAAYYEIFVSSESPTSVTISNASMILGIDPVNSFV